MCGRGVIPDMVWAEYSDWLSLYAYPSEEPRIRYNVAPTTLCPIIHLNENGQRVGGMARWGLIPHWWKKPLSEMKFATFNARSEEAQTKPVFRDAMKTQHCLVPFRGYYEWQGPKGAKQPYFITVRTNAPFIGLAGLWSHVEIDGYAGLTFTILTRAADEVVADIHHRMPIILDEGGYAAWLDGSAGIDEIDRIDETRLQFHPVDPAVGNVRNDDSSLIEPLD